MGAPQTATAALLDGLTPAQRHAVTVEASPLCVLACAGAGKTRVLTRRIAHRVLTGSADAEHVLVITFTRRAAAELGGRLGALGLRDRVAAGTFHALASAALRSWWADRGRPAPTLLDRPARLLGELAAGRPGLGGVTPAELAAHVAWAQARAVAPADFAAAASAARRPLPAPAEALAALMARYGDEKRRRGLVDFDDLLGHCADALTSDATFAAAQRWRWRHVFVDEFQDVNPLQHRLLEAWLGDRRDLCVVGDPAQAIYGWNGADPNLLDTMPERWPGTTVVRLDANHRCSPEVVTAAAAVLGPAGASLTSSRPAGPPLRVRADASDAAEAATTAAEVLAAHADGTPWGQMAVLARTNAQVGVLAGALVDAGVPVRRAGRRLADEPAVAAVLTDWRRHPRTRTQVALADVVEHRRAAAASGSLDTAALAALDALVELGRSLERIDGPGTVADLAAHLATTGGDLEGDADAVTVCSFHRAKGLEWGAVWVCGLEAGLVPMGRGDDDEERRLLYVALTRAGHRLTCSWARTRRFGTAAVPRQPSPWLDLVVPGSGGGRDRSPVTVLDAAAWRARLERQRAALAAGPAADRAATGRPTSAVGLPTADGELLGRLQAWRATAARHSGVPAHVLAHDRTLEAIAALAPTTIDELLAVPGVGPVKAARHGATLLALVAGRSARSA